MRCSAYAYFEAAIHSGPDVALGPHPCVALRYLLTPVQWGRVSRVPLPASDIKTLIDTATNLHSRAIEAQQHQHWYRPLMLQAAAGLLGALIGAWASSQSKPVIPITAASAAQIQQPVSPK